MTEPVHTREEWAERSRPRREQPDAPKDRTAGPVKVLTILLVAFGLAYACLWWSYQRFYGEFGVSPQDVGLAPSGNATDLAGSALQLGIWLLLVIAAMAALPIGALIAANAWWQATRPDSATNELAWLAGATASALLTLAGVLYWVLVDRWVGVAVLASACLLFAVAAVLVQVVTISETNAFVGITNAIPITVSRLAVSIALAAAVVGITFLDLPSDAAEAGKCAAGKPQAVPALNLPFAGVHLPALGVHAQPATVTWIGSTNPGNTPASGNAVYLGQANGAVVIYDRSTHSAIRYPAGDVTVTVDAEAKNCSQVH